MLIQIFINHSIASSFPLLTSLGNCYFHILLQQGMEKPQVLLYLIINVVMPWRGRHSYSEIQDFILAMIKPSLVLAAGRCNSSHNTVQTRCQYLVWIESILNVLSESPVKMIPFWTVTDQKQMCIIHFHFRQHPLFIYLWTLKIKISFHKFYYLVLAKNGTGLSQWWALPGTGEIMNTNVVKEIFGKNIFVWKKIWVKKFFSSKLDTIPP